MWTAARGRWVSAALFGFTIPLAAALPLVAQQPAAPHAYTFDVISIKPHSPGDNSVSVHSNDDSYRADNISLKSLIVSAFDVKMDNLIFGLTGPMADARFDINAKIDADTVEAIKKLPKDQRGEARRDMMRSLLEERFKLRVHRETKESPVFALVVARSGFKLKPADPNPNGIKGADGVARPESVWSGVDYIRAQGIPMSTLASNLQWRPGVQRVVIDKTGLPGKYDFELHFSNDDHSADSGAPSGPSLFAALEEQLGLKLETTKAPLDSIVVDHVEKPTED